MRLFLILFLFPLLLQAQPAAGIQTALETFLSDPDLRNASIGFIVTDTETGRTLASYDADRSLIPASSLKAVTTAAALSVLGADYTFKTEIQYSGSIDAQGILQGNLYLKGYGDPTLGSDRDNFAEAMPLVLEKFAAAVTAAGIRGINGSVIGDGSYFPHAPVASSWQWEDMGNYYGAGAFGLNLHENLYCLEFEQSPYLDSVPRVKRVYPEVPLVHIENLITSAPRGTGDNAYIYGAPFRHQVTIRGTIPAGNRTPFTIKGSVPDAVLFAAHQMTLTLKGKGIDVTGMPQSVFTNDTTQTRKAIYTYTSPTLQKIVYETNHESVNLFCEAMLKAIGLQLADNSDFFAAAVALTAYWKEKGIDVQGMQLRDGSGLSARNLVTARQMVEVLRLTANDKAIFPAFLASLSTGSSGTLRGMFRNTPAYTRIFAKSGSMTGVRSYTGYAQTKDGRLLAFSLIANNFSVKSSVMRRKMERLMTALVEG